MRNPVSVTAVAVALSLGLCGLLALFSAYQPAVPFTVVGLFVIGQVAIVLYAAFQAIDSLVVTDAVGRAEAIPMASSASHP